MMNLWYYMNTNKRKKSLNYMSMVLKHHFFILSGWKEQIQGLKKGH